MEKHNLQNANKHTLELVEASIPHLNGKARKSMELVLKASELLDTLHELPKASDLSACELEDDSVNLESLLLGIQNICTNSEKELIHMLLNFTKAQSIYRSYQSTIRKKGENPDAPDASPPNFSSMLDFLTASMTPEQKSQFENMSMLLQMMQMQQL